MLHTINCLLLSFDTKPGVALSVTPGSLSITLIFTIAAYISKSKFSASLFLPDTSGSTSEAIVSLVVFLKCLRRPYLFRLAGKDRGRKGALGEHLVPAASEFRQQPNLLTVISHQVTLPDPTTRRPSYRNQIWQPLQFHRCMKSVLRIKSVTQYGFALVCF